MRALAALFIAGGIYHCPPAPRATAIRAGRLFDSNTGRMLTNPVILPTGDRITEVGRKTRSAFPPELA